MKKRLLALILALCMVASLLAACGGSSDTPPPAEDTPPPAQTTTDTSSDSDPTDVAPPPDAGSRDHYEFIMYFNYDWANDYMSWGNDSLTQYWEEMFNVTLVPRKPDATPEEALNLLIAADDLPDAIWMERGDQNQRMSRLGLFVPIDDMKAMVDNNWYDGYVGAGTQNFYKVDGVNYCIPNWARSGEIGVKGKATGGNNGWMYTTKVYEAVGSPEVKTFDDVYNYAVAVRDAGLENAGGSPIVPLLFHGGDTDGGVNFVNQAIYCTFGGNTDADWFYNVGEDGTYDFTFRNPLWREAVLEANHWYREGLFPTTNLSNSLEEFLANVNNGRGGLIWYDQSHDDTYQFRKILSENDPGNTLELFIAEDADGWKGVYPPAFGLEVKDIYHHVYGTLGWNGTFITTSAEQPGRIFELLTWMLTLPGSVEMMYGPPGMIWNEVDSNGYPIIHTPESEFTAEELRANGGWIFNFHGASNYWDDAKFAADGALPLEQQSWVIINQRDYFTPNMMLSDEFANMNMAIDPTTELGISRRTISDQFEEVFRQILMAPSRDDCIDMMDDFVAFAEANNVDEIVSVLNDNYQFNKSQQNGFGLRPPSLPANFTHRD